MDNRKNRMSISKLRTSDANTLQVLVQDVLGQPLRQIDPATVVDILALSEITSQMPKSLGLDLDNFRKQLLGQIRDLPDGPVLSEFLEELSGLEAQRLPACLREHLQGLVPQRHKSHTDLQGLLDRLSGEGGAPEVLVLPEPRKALPTKRIAAKAAPPPRPAAGTSLSRVSSAVARPPASMVDDRRALWIEEDVLDRLGNYGSKGLKESVLVAGARHRSSWSDMTDDEVLTVLRRMRRESKVRFSAGRWMLGAG